MPRIVLVGASAELPGLFPFGAWEALTTAEVVWAREPDHHPSAGHLDFADVSLRQLRSDGASLVGVDLLEGAPPAEQALVRALVARAAEDGDAVYLLGPSDGEDFVRAAGLAAARAGIDVEFVFHLSPPGLELLRLVDIERHLLDPDRGCPWDLQQDHASLGRYLVEETYELLDAIETGDDRHIAEELGDVLLQVVFHAEMAAKRGAFTIDDVARGIADKLVHRHPHVFADTEVADAAEVKANWEVLKQQEKARSGTFEGVPGALPALQLVEKLQRRAAKLGFDWEDAAGPAAHVREELEELAAAGAGREEEEELGDVLAAVVALARHLDVDPELALRGAASRFRTCFEVVLALAAERGLDPEELDPATWLDLWSEAKGAEGGRPQR